MVIHVFTRVSMALVWLQATSCPDANVPLKNWRFRLPSCRGRRVILRLMNATPTHARITATVLTWLLATTAHVQLDSLEVTANWMLTFVLVLCAVLTACALIKRKDIYATAILA